MTTDQDPSFYRRRVRKELRTAREDARLTQREAAISLDWSMSKLVRIEAGSVGVSVTDLQAMLALYNIEDDDQVNELVKLARASKERPRYSKYEKVLSPEFSRYLGYESSASVIRSFQQLTVPGLLQTEDYARAIFEALRADRVDDRIELRTTRQELLKRADRPQIDFIFDEAVLYRTVGNVDVMRDQLCHIRDLAVEAGLSVRIIPFAAGAHASMDASFTILEFDDLSKDALYIEAAGGSRTSREDQDPAAKYRETFDWLAEKALNDEESVARIEEMINNLNS